MLLRCCCCAEYCTHIWILRFNTLSWIRRRKFAVDTYPLVLPLLWSLCEGRDCVSAAGEMMQVAAPVTRLPWCCVDDFSDGWCLQVLMPACDDDDDVESELLSNVLCFLLLLASDSTKW